MIGFDATEHHRVGSAGTYDARTTCGNCEGRAKTSTGKPCGPCRGTGQLLYNVRYPLREWGWDRERCQREIDRAGLPVPVKSACFFCPASKQHEITQLGFSQLQLALALERNYQGGKHWRGADASTVGLGRKFTWSDVVTSSQQQE